MLKIFKKNLPWEAVLFILSLGVLYVYYLTSAGHTPYDYFTRLAGAFLDGKYYLSENPPWLNELVPIGSGRYTMVYPPTPAIIAIPFVAIFKSNFYQEYLSWGMGTLAAFTWGVIAFKLTKSKVISLWIFSASAFGNIIWYLAATGSVWYLGQVSGFLFLTLTIYESLTTKQPFLVALYFGLAIFSRLQVAMAFPLILYLNKEIFTNKKSLLLFGLVLIVFGECFALYNFARFGSFTQTGYSLIPGVLKEPWYSKGIFHYSYIKDNLRTMFLSLPNFKNTYPFVTPSWGGLSILITSPFFIYILFAKIKSKLNLITWLSLLMIASVIVMHGGTGFTQFGYRYAVDFYPLIFLLLVNGVNRTRLKWHHWVLLFLAILVNTWGVVFINIFSFVSF